MDQDMAIENQKVLEQIAANLSTYSKERKSLIPILQMIQENHLYLPAEAIEMVAKHLQISTCEVYGVATFYNQFRFIPPGENQIKVCLGTACHVKGGEIILENFERQLEIKDGETTKDRMFSIERVACVGCCALAPVINIGETVHGHMAPSKVDGLLTRVQIEKEIKDREKQKNESNHE